MLRLIRYSRKCDYQIFTLFLNRTCEALAERIRAVPLLGAQSCRSDFQSRVAADYYH
jgi:hypothetical protein